MKNFIILLFATLLFSNLNAQERINVNLFKTTNDYISKTYTDTNMTLVVREIGENHIWFKKFIQDKTDRKTKRAHTSWAIEYKGSTYFNLGYSSDLNNWKVFIKLNSEGSQYCMSFIDENASNVIKNSGTNYGGGLQGVLMKDSSKWGKSWKNKEEQKVKILFIDLANQKEAAMSRNKGSIGNLLKRSELKTKFKLEKTKKQIKEMTFEQVLEIINNAQADNS